MTSQRQLIAPNTKGHECVLLIAADADEAARVLGNIVVFLPPASIKRDGGLPTCCASPSVRPARTATRHYPNDRPLGSPLAQSGNFSGSKITPLMIG
jgi:hypothetical protein